MGGTCSTQLDSATASAQQSDSKRWSLNFRFALSARRGKQPAPPTYARFTVREPQRLGLDSWRRLASGESEAEWCQLRCDGESSIRVKDGELIFTNITGGPRGIGMESVISAPVEVIGPKMNAALDAMVSAGCVFATRTPR